jgi:hypothetical protein
MRMIVDSWTAPTAGAQKLAATRVTTLPEKARSKSLMLLPTAKKTEVRHLLTFAEAHEQCS